MAASARGHAAEPVEARKEKTMADTTNARPEPPDETGGLTSRRELLVKGAGPGPKNGIVEVRG